jgi:hypothetical protein
MVVWRNYAFEEPTEKFVNFTKTVWEQDRVLVENQRPEQAYTWNAIFLPKGAPAEMVNKLNRATVEAMQSANVRERLEGLGAVIVPPVHATPEYLAHFVRSEIEKWTGPIKASGVTVE